jgi:hypothetical protein
VTRILSFLKHNAIALAALFVALGGTSYAAMAIPRNSVGAHQLRRGAVTSTKIHSGAITPGKLASKSFGGRILDLVEIAPGGLVTDSSPKGIRTQSWTEGAGGFVVFPRKLPAGCNPIAGASSTGGAPQPSIGASINGSHEVEVQTSAAANVTLEILCGR